MEGDTQSFIVRIWHEETDEAGNVTAWRGSVDQVGSDQRVHFQDLDQLVRFIQRRARLGDHQPNLVNRCAKKFIAMLRQAISRPHRAGFDG